MGKYFDFTNEGLFVDSLVLFDGYSNFKLSFTSEENVSLCGLSATVVNNDIFVEQL
jgi:hypothetical protein